MPIHSPIERECNCAEKITEEDLQKSDISNIFKDAVAAARIFKAKIFEFDISSKHFCSTDI